MPRDEVRIVQDNLESDADSPFRTILVERYMHPIKDGGRAVVIGPGAQVDIPAFLDECEYVLISFDDQGCRVTFDGQTPTANFGHYFVNTYVIWSKCTAHHLRFASVSNSKTARVHISQFKALNVNCGFNHPV